MYTVIESITYICMLQHGCAHGFTDISILCIISTQIKHSYLVALTKPSRIYSGNGLGWDKQMQCHMVNKCLFLQHMHSTNFLQGIIVTIPLLYAYLQHLLGHCVLLQTQG